MTCVTDLSQLIIGLYLWGDLYYSRGSCRAGRTHALTGVARGSCRAGWTHALPAEVVAPPSVAAVLTVEAAGGSEPSLEAA